VFPHINATEERVNATVDASVEEFLELHKDDSDISELRVQMLNNVKKCTSCGKPCAYTTAACNNCGYDLTSTEISHTNNIFTSFIYGIARGPFPFTISLRSQSENILVFDDLLSLSPCHVNVIPSDVYLRDSRALFCRPVEGLALVNRLADEAWAVTNNQFLADPVWRNKIMPASNDVSEAEMRAMAIAGFNFPPSQFQIHLQHMMPPLMPFHYTVFKKGIHYTYGRFLPLEYVKAALAAQGSTPLEGAADMAIEDVFAYFKSTHGVDYDVIHKECCDRYDADHQRLCNWDPNDFEGKIVGGETVQNHDGTAMEAPEGDMAKYVADARKQDTSVLQNYGRPYQESGRPGGTYYKLAKKERIPNFI